MYCLTQFLLDLTEPEAEEPLLNIDGGLKDEK